MRVVSADCFPSVGLVRDEIHNLTECNPRVGGGRAQLPNFSGCGILGGEETGCQKAGL